MIGRRVLTLTRGIYKGCTAGTTGLKLEQRKSIINRLLHSAPVLTCCRDGNTMSKFGDDFEDKAIQEFLGNIHTILINEGLVEGTSRKNKVTNFVPPEELKTLLDLKIDDGPGNHGDLLEMCSRVIKYSVKTGHPGFYNQLYSGLNAYSLAGAWLTEVLNTNIHTFEVAPAFIIIEKYMMNKMCGIVGYKDGDGVFCPGGSFSNIMAANIARYKACPELRTSGIYGSKKMKLYTSAEAHYSLVKGAVFLGMGSDNVVKVDTDEKGRMIPEELEKKILEDKERGELPAMVMSTSGTTVLGAFDQLDLLADVCDKHGVWLHCDACWGGGAMISNKHKHLVKGMERTKSVSWNLHKLLPGQIQCSALLVSEKGILEKVNRFQAEYLFQQDKCYDTSYDIGDKTVQCGRKVDALKLFFLWKALGNDGMTGIIDHAMDNASYLAEQIRKTEGFRLIIPEFQWSNIGFWYIPPSMRGQEETPEWWDKLSKVAPKIKEGMMKDGTMLIGFCPLSVKGFVNFFRIIIGNTKSTKKDMDFVLQEIDRLGKDL